MTDGSEVGIPEAIDGIKAAIADLLDKCPEANREASRILRLVTALERQLRPAPRPASAGAPNGPPQRRYKSKRYEVHQVGDKEMLAEFRYDSDLPFRCPKAVLDAVVAVLDAADEPLGFTDIQKGVFKELEQAVPDYNLRVCLRFLSSPAAGLITRNRARFGRAKGKLKPAMKAVWQKLTAKTAG